jgi:outer membrane lipase/esterase
MRQFKFGSALLITLILVGCGGGGSDVPAKPKFTSQVSFGDSLSDVGSYQVGTVAALGGGQFTINAASAVKATTPTNWTEFTAPSLNLGMPCAAETGLNGDATQGFSVPVVDHPGCTDYAQGGARVTNPVGPGNALLGGANAILGSLTVPVVTQINHFLAAPGGGFTGHELVTVMAGSNDVLMQLAGLSAGATAAGTAAANAAVAAQIQTDITAGTCTPTDPQATNCQPAAIAELGGTAALQTIGNNAANSYLSTNAPVAAQAMATAATELIGYVNTQILGNGAKYVTVINIPDIAVTPDGQSQDVATQGLIDSLVTAFNSTLKAGIDNMPQANVLYVDEYAALKDAFANPAKYNLTNVTGTACDLTSPYNPLGSSLVCNAGDLTSGVSATDHYLFADTVHPTPYGHLLIATNVLQAMTNKGWY